MGANLASFIVAILLIISITAITILRMVFKQRGASNRHEITDLGERLSQIERRLKNLETIATAKDERLRESFEALARD